MRTIGRHLGRRRTNGDYQAACDYCGADWHRSKMVRDAAGLLACPDDKAGKCGPLLDMLNAENAASIAQYNRARRNPKW